SPKPAAPGGTGATPASPAPAAGTATATHSLLVPLTTAGPSANPRAQTLVSGAPLYNPNVAVHIVERKPFSDQGKHEITLFPALAQVNGKFTQHFGTALSYAYHVHENLAFQLMPQWNWFNEESPFNRELIASAGVEALPATSLLLNWGVTGGVEVVPLYGKFAWYENSLLQFSVVINGAAGYGSTRHELKPRTTVTNPDGTTSTSRATFGDTGNRFLGSIGGGFRVQFGDRFAVRLEVRDLVYTARVDQVNGCDFDDLDLMFRNLSQTDPAQAAVESGCRRETFSQASGGHLDVVRARELVRERSSDVLNLVSFYAGAGFLF
ncbi:MAG TPA: outer membrane beta-barrel domain-containing protein, partial [Myxococcaceae bacterium]|nr:outer membrane beta-barrel domain-containing protein [Myxococcaceae bacterium]